MLNFDSYVCAVIYFWNYTNSPPSFTWNWLNGFFWLKEQNADTFENGFRGKWEGGGWISRVRFCSIFFFLVYTLFLSLPPLSLWSLILHLRHFNEDLLVAILFIFVGKSFPCFYENRKWMKLIFAIFRTKSFRFILEFARFESRCN